ncbi:XdhC family protein [Anaerovorax odorimutans]|uniref:XdhC family protein n=1 Tax=Anaerovorax odorimutans TaxID=109327 RepID=UPI0004071430|nr:XdhC/CoxI family protein [Anaerovorax odorimutans]
MSKISYIGKDLIEKGEDFVLAKVVDTIGSTPRKKGACLLMKKDGTRFGTVGGGTLEAETERIALETFNTKESKIYHFRLKPEEQQGLDMRCGGDADVSIEYIDAGNPQNFILDFNLESKVYIFGAGHVGQALEPVLRYVDFSTVIIDDRPDFANRERFKDADKVMVIDSFLDAYKGIETDENSYIIIVTRGHEADYDVLKQTLDRKTAYIGMIGSKGKVADIYKRLKEDGFTQEQLDRVYSPIGLSIYAETPEEIAISIVGEMIKVRSGHGK